MRARRSRRADISQRSKCFTGNCGFNAGARSRRADPRRVLAGNTTSLLQCGRDDLVARTRFQRASSRNRKSFNAGATISSRGLEPDVNASIAERVLQCGRDDLVARTPTMSRRRNSPQMLQCGRDDLVARTGDTRPAGGVRQNALQCGRDDLVARTPTSPTATRAYRNASMRARRSRRADGAINKTPCRRRSGGHFRAPPGFAAYSGLFPAFSAAKARWTRVERPSVRAAASCRSFDLKR